jgi:two-component system, OmpR family, sensor histidine kinase VicK
LTTARRILRREVRDRGGPGGAKGGLARVVDGASSRQAGEAWACEVDERRANVGSRTPRHPDQAPITVDETFEAALDGEGWLQIDPARIEQAVLILVDNSAKYSPSGGLISLSSWSDRRELHIQVSDRGPGIPEADLPHVFDRFYRVDKVRGRKQGGAGLGLSIAKTTAEAHGGRIEATSHVGQGTRMTIHLPLFEASAADKQPLARSSEEDAR